MLRLSPEKKHELTDAGLQVYLEAEHSLALTSPEAQRFVSNYAKDQGFGSYGLNKFVKSAENMTNGELWPQRGHWLLLPAQWNKKSIRV